MSESSTARAELSTFGTQHGHDGTDTGRKGYFAEMPIWMVNSHMCLSHVILGSN